MKKFYNTAKISIYVVDHVVQEQYKGGVNPKENIWYISNAGKNIVKESRIAINLKSKSIAQFDRCSVSLVEV